MFFGVLNNNCSDIGLYVGPQFSGGDLLFNIWFSTESGRNADLLSNDGYKKILSLLFEEEVKKSLAYFGGVGDLFCGYSADRLFELIVFK